MNKNETYLVIGIFAVIILAVAFSMSSQQPAPSDQTQPTPTPTPYTQQPSPTYPPYPTYPPTPTAPPDNRAPTSLYVTIEPNPVTMGGWVYGEVVSDGYKYPITVHAKHVGAAEETTFGALLDEDGQFYHSQTLDTPGYWDFWVTTDSVTSNMPRLTVQGAMLTSSKTSFSRSFGGMTTTLKLYCHSSGNAQIFANDPDAGTSIPMKTVHISSGGYAETTFDFSGWSLGNYELDFVVNGIKASDYGESVWIFLGR